MVADTTWSGSFRGSDHTRSESRTRFSRLPARPNDARRCGLAFRHSASLAQWSNPNVPSHNIFGHRAPPVGI